MMTLTLLSFPKWLMKSVTFVWAALPIDIAAAIPTRLSANSSSRSISQPPLCDIIAACPFIDGATRSDGRKNVSAFPGRTRQYSLARP